MIADPRFDCVRRELRRAVAVPAQPRRLRSGAAELSGLRRHAAPGVPPRDGAVLRERRSRGSQRARPAARRLHVPQRAARRHYGIADVKGSHFRRVDARRRTARAAACSARAAFSRSRRIRIARRRSCAANGFSRTCSARRRRRRRRTCRRAEAAERSRRRCCRCASGWSSIGEPGVRGLPRDDGSRSAWRSRTSTASANGARWTSRAARSTRRE